jgi:hypothetical protein
MPRLAHSRGNIGLIIKDPLAPSISPKFYNRIGGGVLGASLQRHAKGTNLAFFCKKVEKSEVPEQRSCTDAIRDLKSEVARRWLGIGAEGRSRRPHTTERTEVFTWRRMIGAP